MVQAIAATPEQVNHWFLQCLKPELDELKLLDNPKFIFNIDETGFPLGGKPVKIVSLVTGRWVWKGEYYCSNLYFWGGRASSAFCDI